VGSSAGNGITTVNNNIVIGHLSGVHSVFGQVSNRCFIDNIYGAPVSAGTAAFVLIDSNGRLGTFTVAAAGADTGGFSPLPAPGQAVPQGAKQAMLNRKVEKLQATVGQQQKQIETLTAQLKEQAAQIQKVSAQLEVNKPTPKLVLSNP
jgi:Tfp pilus assembly protein FimV